ncbi:MAG: 2-C-methyl-D-erythritol 4-phosphate cytidylyltransferase [Clostridia bacterium]|nr:2-C-methyl-D-erythritol 4-phosphate cytidylyltransferase [Clostridia bacterium]
MQILETINTIARAAEGFAAHGKHPYTSAVILAGGIGSRMAVSDKQKQEAGAVTKQFLALGGEPVILRTVRMFEECPVIDEIVLVIREEERALYAPMLSREEITKVKKIVAGGETRQDSAYQGLLAVDRDCAFIAIHDGARPLITPEQITAVAREAYRIGAAAAASRVKDTVKITEGAGYVKETPDRTQVWAASTPQIFKVEEYRASVYLGREKKLSVTDDCGLVEAVGFPVKLVDIGYQNLKITTREDLYFADAILKMRRDAESDEKA